MAASLFQHTKQVETCPQCGGLLQLKQGKKGRFFGCVNYPTCDYLRPLPRLEWKVLKTLAETCPECGAALQLKQGNFGLFIGCSRFPDCRFIVHDEPPPDNAALPCPECKQGELTPRRSRQGKTFYGCSRFPHCRFSLPARPVAQPCPQCGFPLSLPKGGDGRRFQCADKGCRHNFELSGDA